MPNEHKKRGKYRKNWRIRLRQQLRRNQEFELIKSERYTVAEMAKMLGISRVTLWRDRKKLHRRLLIWEREEWARFISEMKERRNAIPLLDRAGDSVCTLRERDHTSPRLSGHAEKCLP